MHLKTSILSFFCVIATAANKNHHIRANSDDDHQLGFHATENALRQLLKQESIRSTEDAGETNAVLHGSGRFLKDVTCGTSPNDWTCDKDTQECGSSYPVCDVVCDPKSDCNGNGRCKKGKCECYERFDGYSCDKCAKGYYKYKDDCRYKDVGVDYEFKFDVPEDAEYCTQVIDDLQGKLDGLADGLPDQARVRVSGGTRKSRRLSSRSNSDDLLITIEVPVVECNQTAVVNAAILAVQDVSAPTRATFLSRKSRGSRD